MQNPVGEWGQQGQWPQVPLAHAQKPRMTFSLMGLTVITLLLSADSAQF